MWRVVQSGAVRTRRFWPLRWTVVVRGLREVRWLQQPRQRIRVIVIQHIAALKVGVDAVMRVLNPIMVCSLVNPLVKWCFELSSQPDSVNR